MHQEENPTTVSQLLAQIEDLQNKVNSLQPSCKWSCNWHLERDCKMGKPIRDKRRVEILETVGKPLRKWTLTLISECRKLLKTQSCKTKRIRKRSTESMLEKTRFLFAKDKMVFSEESSRAIFEVVNVELIELKKTSGTFQCPSCLKGVFEGTTFCKLQAPCLAATLDCRVIHKIFYGYFRKRFWTTTCWRRTILYILQQFKEFGILFSRIETWYYRNYKEAREWNEREPLNTSIALPHIQRGGGMLNHTGGTYSRRGVIGYPRSPISEMHLGKFPDSMEFQSWKVNFKAEVCSKTADPHLRMQWIKEVEMAKSVDELVTSRSIVGRTYFTDFDVLDAMIASALKRLISRQAHSLAQGSKCRRPACPEFRPILTWKAKSFHDQRAFPCIRTPWSGARTLRFFHFKFTEWRCPRFRR